MEIRLKLDNIDYGELAVKMLPLVGDKLKESDNTVAKLLSGVAKMPPSIIKTTVNALPQETKDEVVALLINKNKDKIKRLFMDFANTKGIDFDILDIEVDS
ncbi:MAG: hypothetical protein IKJ01_06295 [Lachnospiraceae bacterium]|nr:hypothetical protein [Lachnospiraceae bacterium]